MTSVRNKILSLEKAALVADSARAEGKAVVLCHGVFDLIHPGHIRHFQEAKRLGDVLFVSLTQDAHVNKGPGRPLFTDVLRAETIAALECVDYVLVNHAPTALEPIRALRPSFYVKGQDYENRSGDITQGIFAEEAAVNEVGGKIHFTHDLTFSSTQILNSQFGVYPEKAREFLTEFRSRQSADAVISSLQELQDLRVLVLGDTIVDEYHYCQPLGKSPKETIVTTRYLSEEAFPGGILACANHLAAFAKEVHLVSCLGAQNTRQDLITSQLKSKVTSKFFIRDDASTVIKRRYVEPAFLTKMFQISFLTDTDIPAELSGSIVRYLREALPNYDLVVVADYGHGFIDRAIRETLQTLSPFLALNVQTNSANLGYNLVTKYAQANYICIDEPELRLALQAKYEPIQPLMEEFAERYPESLFTITRGHNGSVTSLPTPRGGREFFEAPSVSSKIVDRVGAGDAYFAITSMLAAKGASAQTMGLVGNAVGAMAVEVVCNRSSLEPVPLYKFLKALLA